VKQASALSLTAMRARKVVTMQTPLRPSARNATPARPVLLKELIPAMLARLAIVANTLLRLAQLNALNVPLENTLT